MTASRASVLVVLAVLASLSLTACSAFRDAADTSSLDLVRSAAARTMERGTFRFEQVIEGTDGEESATFIATGAVDIGRRYTHVRADSEFVLVPEQIVHGTGVYFRPGQLLGAGKEGWVFIDFTAVDPRFDDTTIAALLAYWDPATVLPLISAAAIEAREVGTETVRGHKTRHVMVVIDLRLWITQSPLADFLTPEELEAELAERPESAEIELWIDSEQRVVRTRVSREESHGDGTYRTTDTTEYFDFGVPVQIFIPPPHEVVPLEEWGELVGDWDD